MCGQGAVPVPGGEAFSSSQRDEIARAIRVAEQLSGFRFSVFTGASESESRVFAERLHAHLEDPARSVLVMVDPAARRVEIVTGTEVSRVIDDASAGLAALSMQSAFAAGDLVGGIVSGVQQLGERARQPRSLHTDTG
jgi:uncharacterized membrane protein YgcG